MSGKAGGRPTARPAPVSGGGAARTPFVLLVVALLAGGLITLLVLNSALNTGSFRLSELQKETERLTDEEQALRQQVDGWSDPARLARRARELGMVPGGNPAFLGPDGTVSGTPERAPTPPPSALPSSAPPSAPPPSAASSPSAVASSAPPPPVSPQAPADAEPAPSARPGP